MPVTCSVQSAAGEIGGLFAMSRSTFKDSTNDLDVSQPPHYYNDIVELDTLSPCVAVQNHSVEALRVVENLLRHCARNPSACSGCEKSHGYH